MIEIYAGMLTWPDLRGAQPKMGPWSADPQCGDPGIRRVDGSSKKTVGSNAADGRFRD
jgi:hypothetical protein